MRQLKAITAVLVAGKCNTEGRGGLHALPIFSKLQQGWSIVSHAARVSFVILFFGNNSLSHRRRRGVARGLQPP